MSVRQTAPLGNPQPGESRRSDELYNLDAHRLSQVVENIHEGLCVVDEDGKVMIWNAVMESITGIRAGAMLGKPMLNAQLIFVPAAKRTPQAIARIQSTIERLLKTGEAPGLGHATEYEYLHPDGSLRHIESRMAVAKTNRGHLLITTLNEVTERKRADEAVRASEIKFRSIIAQAEDGIILLDDDCVIQEWNTGLERMTGIPRPEAAERPLLELAALVMDDENLPNADRSFSELYAEIASMTRSVLRSGSVIKIERELQPTDKPSRFVHLLLFPLRMDSQNLVGGILRDVTELKSTERAFRRQADQLETLRRSALDISAELGLETLLWLIAPRAIELMNGAAMALYLHNPDTDILEVAITMGDNQPPLEPFCKRGQGLPGQVWEKGEPVLLEEYRTGRTDPFHRSLWGKVAGVPLVWGNDFIGVLFVFSDVSFGRTDLKLLGLFGSHAAASIRNARMHRELHELAITDALTNIFNRHHFFELAEAAFGNARRYTLPLSALMMDLDFFKQVNDTHGHLAGDEVLRVSIQRCARIIRETDTFGRYGGEEFVMILPETDLLGAQVLAERLRQAVCKAPIPIGEQSIHITASFGVAQMTEETATLQELLNRADQALYKAKQAGRDQVSAWVPTT